MAKQDSSKVCEMLKDLGHELFQHGNPDYAAWFCTEAIKRGLEPKIEPQGELVEGEAKNFCTQVEVFCPWGEKEEVPKGFLSFLRYIISSTDGEVKFKVYSRGGSDEVDEGLVVEIET